MIEAKFIERISQEAGVSAEHATAAIALLDKGATVPFIRKYRRDAVGDMGEARLERVEALNLYFTALSSRRDAILQNIENQGRLGDTLRAQIEACFEHAALEDIYMPYRKARRTRAGVAREHGLEPLADLVWAQELPSGTLSDHAQGYLNADKKISSVEEALQGVFDILSERVSLDPAARAIVRDHMLGKGVLKSRATKNADGQKTKFESYYNYEELLSQIPSHRLLAVQRGVRMGLLRIELSIEDETVVQELIDLYLKPTSPHGTEIQSIVWDAYKRWLRPAMENDVLARMRERADEEAIRVFRENAENLLMSSPAGALCVMGIDASQSAAWTGAIVSAAGSFIAEACITPGTTPSETAEAQKNLLSLLESHRVAAIAIGNAPNAREAARFMANAIKTSGKQEVFFTYVNDQGAEAYASSRLARQELPDLSLAARAAASIARRLQDPLAELVKVDPRSIGVGQYQHDVSQRQLREGLHRSVESCVNRVGVDVNRAAPELLRYVSGIQMGTAQNIVEFKEKNGAFKNREQLKQVSGIGEKTFEQCAGLLRIKDGDNPLDATAIHPEAYPLVARIAESFSLSIADLLGNKKLIDARDMSAFLADDVGPLMLEGIRSELLHPGRDPRTPFKSPKLTLDFEPGKELEVGHVTEGVVTNVTDFGAFVDVGIEQDGLVHLSEMSDRFVRDPREIVNVGDVIKVKVLRIDRELKRISLSLKAARRESDAPRSPRRHASGAPAPHAVTAEGSREGNGAGETRRDAVSRTERPQAPRRDKKGPRGKKGVKPATTHSSNKPQVETRELFNTVLADQLAAMKKNLGS